MGTCDVKRKPDQGSNLSYWVEPRRRCPMVQPSAYQPGLVSSSTGSIHPHYNPGRMLDSIYLTQGPNQTVIGLSTGTTCGAAPQFYVDAMYKNVPGANFSKDLQSYILPCDTRLNISMVFGENTYPINPMDATYVLYENNITTCVGAFSYTTGKLDFILGDTFMRNVYSLFDFGHWTEGGKGLPFMQILSHRRRCRLGRFRHRKPTTALPVPGDTDWDLYIR
ncbi:aspartic peptidase domain-containing protein [Amylocystis lapponica]|nr:aspartic peptidase domain-containing protein [Amylocystis lapponica]